MLHVHRAAANLLFFCSSAGAVAVGCFFNRAGDCELNPILDCFASGAVSSSGGDDSGPPPDCAPSAENPIIADACGVFVSSTRGDDAADGSKVTPLKTLAAAVDKAAAQGTNVYACAEELSGSVTLSAPVAIHGGFDCKTDWAYTGASSKSLLLGTADEVALTLTAAASGAKIVDFTIRAKNAAKEGASSVAVLADAATAELIRCDLIAGNGAKGVTGAHGDPNGAPAAAGTAGNNGKNACSDLDGTPGADTKLPGGDQVINDCAGDISVGGSGGDGNILNGGGGDDGQVGLAGLGGKGQPSSGLWSCIEGAGQIGTPGDPGMPGAIGAGLGTISSSGYLGPSGGAGDPGKPGQGGGGGGGAKGGLVCSGANGAGASGGSGGASGCGGLPGQGGGPGGASIALLSFNASIKLTDCSLKSGFGGTGGSGGDLQPGGSGGEPGKGGQGAGGSKPACSGGQGGSGGNGGPGGGGLGGPSFGIAYKGSPPVRQGATTVTPGTAGGGGLGGSVNVAKNAGAPGTSAEEQLFPD